MLSSPPQRTHVLHSSGEQPHQSGGAPAGKLAHVVARGAVSEKLSLDQLPPPCEEGEFQFFTASEIEQLDIPQSDHEQIWPLFQKNRGGFFSGHFRCIEGDTFEWTLEESRPATTTHHE